MSFYEDAVADERVYAILTDRSLNHQQATDDINHLLGVVVTSRTSVRRAREKLGVLSPATTGPVYSTVARDLHDLSGCTEESCLPEKPWDVYAAAQSRDLNHQLANDSVGGIYAEKPTMRTPAFEKYLVPKNIEPETEPVRYGSWDPSRPATAVFLGDWQTGCENQTLIDASIELIKDLQPDVIGHTGDETDNTVLGRWVKGTGDEYTGTLQDQVDRAERNLRAISEVAPDSHRHLADSNHNQRLEKAVAERLPGLESLRCLKMEKLLRLSENGWEFHREQYEILPELLLFHGHAEGFGSGTPLKRIEDFLLRKGKNFIFGHTHRFGLHTTSQGYEFDMRTLFAANPGHMMDLHHADYIRHKSPNWSSGLVIVHYDGSDLYPETVLAKDNHLFYNGKRY